MLTLNSYREYPEIVFELTGERREVLFFYGLLHEVADNGLFPVDSTVELKHNVLSLYVYWLDAQILLDFLAELCKNEGVSVDNYSDYQPNVQSVQLELQELVIEDEIITLKDAFRKAFVA